MRNLLDNQYVQSPATIFAKCNIFQRIFSYVGILSLLLNMQSNSIQAQSMDTLVCDNGGFEDDFEYYKGYFAIFDSLNTTACIPYYSGNAVSWGSIGQPLFRRFEITSNGLDTLTGIDRVRFGSKALLLNNRYGHNLSSDPCIPQSDVNMIRKRFKVTADNREFTIWYAVILENPSSPGHSTNRPFFSISCDKAPEYNLCFDSNILKCGEKISDSLCVFDTIQYVNWTCHRIKIPKNMVDSIATLEIIASDCGANHHFGYAYIDGICEDCSGSTLGTGQLYDSPYTSTGNGIKYKSCDGQSITVCGSYSLPLECGSWAIDSINILEFDVNHIEIDTANQHFCFDLPLSNFSEFTEDSCRDIFVKFFFSSNLGASVTTLSNSIEICYDDYEEYLILDTIGICQNNGTSNLLSDDYYYVRLITHVNEGDRWDVYRKLDDPYPNESGQYLLTSGSGLDSVDLGPFLIQEGSWELIIDLGDCNDTFVIT